MRAYLKSIKERDPAARHALQILLTYPGVHALFWYRIAHAFWNLHLKLLAEIIMQAVRFFTLIEIHPGATIGRRLFIDHGAGVVIGATAIIGDDCLMFHGSTLGGTGHAHAKRHPTLGNRVLVGTGAKILGNITIGDDAKIGADTVVLHDVPAGATVVGEKSHILNR